ncbi:hypothetical protein FACS18942_02230 [Planctomycetales bacterium]|nr:hypothetical protein FACS18942_02230 [Planctomycetales bacterium]
MFSRFYYNVIIAVSFLLIFLSETAIFASDEAILLLLKAAENRGSNPVLIQTGTAEFDIVIKHTSGESNQQIKVSMLGNNLHCLQGKPKECVRLLEERTMQITPEKFSWHSFTLVKGYINQDDVYTAFVWKPEQLLLERFRGTRDIRSVPEFQEFGRFQVLSSIFHSILLKKLTRFTQTGCRFPDDLFPADAAEIIKGGLRERGMTCEITGEIQYDGDAAAKVIEIKKDGNCVETYHIDTSRGFICPYIRRSSGKAEFEFSSEDYIQETNSSLYYPLIYTEKSKVYFTNKEKEFNQDSIQEYRLIPDTLKFNYPVSEEEFTLHIPSEAIIHDWLPRKAFTGMQADKVKELIIEENKKRREPVPYRSIKNGTVSFKNNFYEIEKLPWIVLSETHKPSDNFPAKQNTQTQHTYRRIVFIVAGLLLILFALMKMRK